MAALQLACGATDEEWAVMMERLRSRDVPDTADKVVATIRASLADLRDDTDSQSDS